MNLFENLQMFYESNDLTNKIYNICKLVRNKIISKYGKDHLYSSCIETSDMIIDLLSKEGIKAHVVEGYCIYDDIYFGSDRPWDEHAWVELEDKTYIDVTADQFESGMFRDIPEIIIGDKPEYMVYEEPDFDDYDM